jgi:septum formation protein
MSNPIVLGSSSPRRQDLLQKVGLSFKVIKPEVEEVHRPGETPKQYVLRNADEKAAWVLEQASAEGAVIISADTVVVLGNEILEKPKDEAEAFTMLSSLSGSQHTVVTGVCLASKSKKICFATETAVTIKELLPEEIKSYIKSGEPLDKAGGYAAQGIGSYMVKSINGSYANVVGLPIAEVVEVLNSEFNITIWS